MAEFEPVTLFVRGDEDSSGDDVWDDTILVEQYDRSVNQLKNKVAKLMGVNNSEGDNGSARDMANSHAHSRSKHHKKKQALSWTVGSFCRAKYSADKLFYEAIIISIDQEKGTCTIRYLGYDNQEEVHLDSLQLSKGRSARKSQQEQALAEQLSGVKEAEDTEEMVHSESYSDREESKNTRTRCEQSFTDRRHSKGQRGKISPHDFKMLPPPNVPALEGQPLGGPSNFRPFSSLPPPPPPPPHLFEHLPNDDGEALSAMLMSWYMSGYHTGYYYGLKQAKSQQNKHHHGKWRKT